MSEVDLNAEVDVKVIKIGFIYGILRKKGDLLTVKEGEFSKKWMERVEKPTKKSAKKKAD